MGVEQRDTHTKKNYLFREVQGIDKALVQQLIWVVDLAYIAPLRRSSTNALQGFFQDILEHLKTVYRTVTSQMLKLGTME